MIILILILFGLCLGSFTNALVWRLHEQERLHDKKKLSKADQVLQKDLSVTTGRSMCPHCHHQLAAADLIPVISWLWLRGRCRYCRQPIPDTPLPELLTPFLFVVSYLAWPRPVSGWQLESFIVWLVLVVTFVALFLYDSRWMLLPNKLIWPAVGLAGAQWLLTIGHHGGMSAFLGGVYGVLIASGIFYVLFQASQGRWIGGGDVKLGVALGLILGGPSRSLLMLFLASLFGTVYGLPALARKQAQRRIPFGPFLLAGTIVAKLYGSRIIDWYASLFIR